MAHGLFSGKDQGKGWGVGNQSRKGANFNRKIGSEGEGTSWVGAHAQFHLLKKERAASFVTLDKV